MPDPAYAPSRLAQGSTTPKRWYTQALQCLLALTRSLQSTGAILGVNTPTSVGHKMQPLHVGQLLTWG